MTVVGNEVALEKICLLVFFGLFLIIIIPLLFHIELSAPAEPCD
jgi:hypothetical protein